MVFLLLEVTSMYNCLSKVNQSGKRVYKGVQFIVVQQLSTCTCHHHQIQIWKILPGNLMMTDHFKRQEKTDPKHEIEISMVVVDESIAACTHHKDDIKQTKKTLLILNYWGV